MDIGRNYNDKLHFQNPDFFMWVTDLLLQEQGNILSATLQARSWCHSLACCQWTLHGTILPSYSLCNADIFWSKNIDIVSTSNLRSNEFGRLYDKRPAEVVEAKFFARQLDCRPTSAERALACSPSDVDRQESAVGTDWQQVWFKIFQTIMSSFARYSNFLFFISLLFMIS